MRLVRSFLAGGLARVIIGAAVLGSIVSVAPPTVAQSAADKATARQLATQGIDQYKAGKFTEALDKLQRAEQLYDAPVHLVYIARCQAQLGQFVEAAEAYRRLVRTQLPDNAPQVFKDAVADAKKELPDVEPKIAALRINIEPAGAEGLKLEIDGMDVPTAALGADRPVNPGRRKVTVSAKGYKSLEETLELKPGEKKKLQLKLEVDPDAAAAGAGGAGGSGGEGGASAGAGGAKNGGEGGAAGAAPAEAEGNFGFLVGARVGASIPAGELASGYQMKDFFGPGGGVELRGGVRVFRQYSALLLFGANSYQPGKSLELGPPETTIKVVPQGIDLGVGLMYSAPPGKMGLFGELDFLFIHRFDVKRDIDWKAPRADCSQTLKALGTALRLTGGLQIPMTPWLQLSPYAAIAFGQSADFSLEDGCGKATTPPDPPNSNRVPLFPEAGYGNIPKTPWGDPEGPTKAGHFVVSLGIGGDILFGSDKPSKL
ncbi:MAG: PEGA domain-containing protein [Myxococcales bacterium]|nr:PEGA domain-containing protein [Myxococcales bacterium]